MPFLTIAGIEVNVQARGFQEDEPYKVGAESRAFAGNYRSTVRAEKRRWTVTLAPMTDAELTTLRNAVRTTFQTCGGDVMGGGVLCRIILTSAPYVRDGLGFKRVATFRLEEV